MSGHGVLRVGGDVRRDPWPVLVTDEAFEPALFERLCDDLPDVEDFGAGFRMHGDLTAGDARYERPLHESAAWRLVHDVIYSAEFVEQVLETFRDELDELHRAGELLDPLHDWEYIDLPTSGVQLRSELVRPASFPRRTDALYTRLDIGVGLEGYGVANGGRGVHTDNRSRLLSGLVYFSSQRDLTGGEFEIHRLRGRSTELVERIAVEPNRGIFSLQTNRSFHAVHPLVACATPRFAAYFAVTSALDIWSPIADRRLASLTQNRALPPTRWQAVRRRSRMQAERAVRGGARRVFRR